MIKDICQDPNTCFIRAKLYANKFNVLDLNFETKNPRNGGVISCHCLILLRVQKTMANDPRTKTAPRAIRRYISGGPNPKSWLPNYNPNIYSANNMI